MNKKKQNIFEKIKTIALKKTEYNNTHGLMSINAEEDWHKLKKSEIIHKTEMRVLESVLKRAYEFADLLLRKNKKYKDNLKKGTQVSANKRMIDKEAAKKLIFKNAKKLKKKNPKLSNADLARKLITGRKLSKRYTNYKSIQNILNNTK
jgi:hypothetical protein